MGASEVIQLLQALDVKTLGMGAAEKKAEVRAQVGLPRDVEPAAAAGKTEEVAGERPASGAVKGAAPKVAPGSTAEKKGKVGGGAVEGGGKVGGSGAGKLAAEKKG